MFYGICSKISPWPSRCWGPPCGWGWPKDPTQMSNNRDPQKVLSDFSYHSQQLLFTKVSCNNYAWPCTGWGPTPGWAWQGWSPSRYTLGIWKKFWVTSHIIPTTLFHQTMLYGQPWSSCHWGPPPGWAYYRFFRCPRPDRKNGPIPRWSAWKTEGVGCVIFALKAKMAVRYRDGCAFLLR